MQELFTSPSYVASFLAMNGVLLYAAEFLRTKAKSGGSALDPDERIATEVSWRQSTGVGVMQVLALLPGFSRTGSTIAGGLMVGLAHEDALRFSFLLATPIIAAAVCSQAASAVRFSERARDRSSAVRCILRRTRVILLREVLDQVFQDKNAYPVRRILFGLRIDQLAALAPMACNRLA